MDAGAIVGLACLVAIVAAFIIARRRGGKAFTAAVAEARAEGRAEAAASAVASGNRVDLHLGHGQHFSRDEWSVAASGERGPFDDRDEAERRSAAIVRAELRSMDAMQRRRVLDEIGVGELLDGLQHRSDAVEPDRRAVGAGGTRDSDVRADGHPSPLSWGRE